MICFISRRAITLHTVSRFPQTQINVSNSFVSIRSFSSPSGSTISSVGLPSEAVTSSEKKSRGGRKKKNLQLSGSREHADSVLSMLRSYGFVETQIDTLFKKSPKMMTIKISIQQPKLEFFREIGFSSAEIATAFSKEPLLFECNLQKKMVPNFELLCKLFGGKYGAVKAVKKDPRMLRGNVAGTLLPNIEVLRKHGLVGEDMADIWSVRSGLLYRKTNKLEEYIKKLNEMGCHLSAKMKIAALAILATNSGNTWDRKVSLFKGFGWTDVDFLEAFKRCPTFLQVADKSLKERLDFFMNKLNYTAAALSAIPVLLKFSLENRIKPRWAVFNLLASNKKTMKLSSSGIWKKNNPGISFFNISDQKFFHKYVRNYQKDVPEVLEAYNVSKEFPKVG